MRGRGDMSRGAGGGGVKGGKRGRRGTGRRGHEQGVGKRRGDMRGGGERSVHELGTGGSSGRNQVSGNWGQGHHLVQGGHP